MSKYTFTEEELLLSYHFEDNHPLLIDVGAGVGDTALPYAQRTWRVIAFEPEKNNYREAVRMLSKFDKVKIVNKAVSNVDRAVLNFYVSKEHVGIHSLIPFYKTHKLAYKVKTVTLDKYLRANRIPKVTFLKIDVEGSDFLALQGFDLKRYQPEIVMVEFMDSRSKKYYNYGYKDMIFYMRKFGYKGYISVWGKIKEYGRKDKQVKPHKWIKCMPVEKYSGNPAWGNLIFIKVSRNLKFKVTLGKYLLSIKIKNLFDMLNIFGAILNTSIVSIKSLFNNILEIFKLPNSKKLINFIDVGSVGELPEPWLTNSKFINNVLKFEPRDKNSNNKNVINIDSALWESKKVKNFYIYQGLNGTGSSLFEQNYSYVKNNYKTLSKQGDPSLASSWFERSKLEKKILIECDTLDHVLSQIHTLKYNFLKIDAQGAEFNILKGAEKFLKEDCIGLHLELFKIPLYKGIRLRQEVIDWLSKYHFQVIKEYPSHGTFNSQNDVILVKKNASADIKAIISNVYDVKITN